jgi:hypothetical protein
LNTRQKGDYLSDKFIILINELISKSGLKFRRHIDSGDMFLICVTDNEADLMSNRGFRFRDLLFNTERDRDPKHFHRHHSQDYVWLFINRGIINYRSGDQAEAWENWNYAAELGNSKDVYSIVSEIVESGELVNYF